MNRMATAMTTAMATAVALLATGCGGGPSDPPITSQGLCASGQICTVAGTGIAGDGADPFVDVGNLVPSTGDIRLSLQIPLRLAANKL